MADLRMGCDNNPDGFGWALITPERRILTGRSMIARLALEEFKDARDTYPESHAIFHSRITTDGSTTIDNTHPFPVAGRDDMVLAHNGWVPSTPAKGDTRSDTRIMAEEVLMERFPNLDSRKTRRRLRKWIGNHSKVVILSTNPAYRRPVYMINEEAGSWHNGVWHSNTSWKYAKPQFTPWYGGTGYGIARASRSYREGWDSELGAVSGVTAYICATCREDDMDCDCVNPGVRIPADDYMMTGYLTGTPGVNEDYMDPNTWVCDACRVVGEIDPDTCECLICGFMWCCDSPATDCQCSPGPVGTGPAVLDRTL